MTQKYQTYMEQPSQEKTWKVALYIRLSKEDGDKGESYSVTSQREILMEYLKSRPEFELYDTYVDDGWSGTNFDRPDFKRMMEDIYEGKVNCVIVKDLSRFGRNYTESGNYIDNVFVRLKVRFIALNNGVDSFSNTMNSATQCIAVGVQNVINESVAATTSVNVRGTLNVSRRQGKFIGSFACYGYKKDPADHHKLIIDEEAAEVVRMIYKLFLDGTSILGIVRKLNALKIPNPTAYKKKQGLNYSRSSGETADGLWCDQTVRRILKNEMYIGNMVQGKNTTISYKIKQCRAVPQSEWIIVKNTHEPIIDNTTFAKVQALLNDKKFIRSSPVTNQVDLFAGVIRCADCGRAMGKKTNRHNYGTYRYYRCVTYNKLGGCSLHSVRIDLLEEIVLYSIKAVIDSAIELEALLDDLEHNVIELPKSNAFAHTINQKIAERDKYKNMALSLYPDFKNGLITKEEYTSLKTTFVQKQKELEESIAALEKQGSDSGTNAVKHNAFTEHFLQYAAIDKLTRPIVNELIDSIYVHRDKAITINFKFTDAYMDMLDYIDELKRRILEERGGSFTIDIA